ncbi:DUF3604 domain-containing protein [Myxococcota bacterium]|nr:DUF3604 domain-containing protein [Myxococcota bacterium]
METHQRSARFWALLLALWMMPACLLPSGASGSPAVGCRNHTPLRQVLWGDLHIHTGISMDAYIFETRLGPEDAYRFAKGEEMKLPPLDASGVGTTPLQIPRPLDFAAVTDHAHSFGGVRLCTDPESPAYANEICTRYRRPFRAEDLASGVKDIVERVDSLRSDALCGPEGSLCRDAARSVWQDTQRAAARFNAGPPDCDFTTFVAYEHTDTPRMTKIHRNVIFRNASVPDLPINSIEAPSAAALWQRLENECLNAEGDCDVLAIPHNPNLSNGQMFSVEYPEGSSLAEQARLAALRARMEPVVEMMQMKGESECRAGMWKVFGSDEDCDFEKIRDLDGAPDCRDGKGWGALANQGCISRLDFARYALVEGLREGERIGVNPYAFGMIGSTDIHTGASGATAEWAESVSVGSSQPSIGNNPGGLAAVWAEENSRESIFQALRRREVYATSGSRMAVRFFGGWEYPEDLCSRDDLTRAAYAGGVPMGGDLPPQSGGSKSPVFVVSALRDAGTSEHPGTALQRVQIVKGWTGPDGATHQQVVDVAGNAANGARVDLKTCEPRGPGADSLCGVWRDPDFDPQQRAVYYARVLENPSCRYVGWLCRQPESHAACADPNVPKVIQERAWTSPIWYTPPTESGPSQTARVSRMTPQP